MVSHKTSAHSYLSHLKYRADIDGLHAIAIISVVWFMEQPFYGQHWARQARGKTGVIIYRDSNHLNANGSEYLGPKIVNLLGI